VTSVGSRHPRRRFAGALFAALPILALHASPAAGAEPTELPEGTISAAVSDLDGDGAREVVRMLRPEPESEDVWIDAWRHGRDGWQPLRGRVLMGDSTRNVGALLRVVREGRDVLLALTAIGTEDNSATSCCLSIAEVREANGALSLAPIVADDLDGGATYVQSIDFDADGTDELLTMRTSFRTSLDGPIDPDQTFLEVLAWRHERLAQVAELGPIEGSVSAVAGETDGRPGVDLVIGPNVRGRIQRLTAFGGAFRVDEGQIDIRERGGDYYGYVYGIAGELMVISDPRGVRTVSWPFRGEPSEVGFAQGMGEYPWITTVGAGSDALLVHFRQDISPGGAPVSVYDLGLRRLGDVSPAAEADAFRRIVESGLDTSGIGINPFPYIGPLPSQLADGQPSMAVGGVMILADGDGGFETRPMSPMIGLHPHGTAGPDDAWLAASSGGLGFGTSDAVYLAPGLLASTTSGRMTLIPVDDLWHASTGAIASVELDGAVIIDEDRLLAQPDGFSAVIDAPAGSIVFAGSTRIEAYEVDGEEAITAEFTPQRGVVEHNTDFEYRVLVSTPDGRVWLQEWEGTVVREPPELEATSASSSFQLAAGISGSAGAHVELFVDGQPVAVDSDGDFAATVDAPPWPRDVVVTARDPLGNETSISLEVIGFVDYRGLPWIPIMGLATVLVGAYVFLRVPRGGRGPVPAVAGEGTLEEIDGD
jgi:hypothetical protein